jgi:hypothetical protein
MLSDDVFRAELATAFAALVAAANAMSDVASVDTVFSPAFARLSLIPHVAAACPVEIMLRADQAYDILIGTEFYEDCPVERFDLFKPLLIAVAEGNVVQRHHISVATGTERRIETIVTLPGGEVWRNGHTHGGAASAVADDATVFQDRRFVPYRR